MAGWAFVLDEAIFVGDLALGILDHLFGSVDNAVGRSLGEGDEEALLHVNGLDAGGGGEQQQEACNRLHCCGCRSGRFVDLETLERAVGMASCRPGCTETSRWLWGRSDKKDVVSIEMCGR